MNEGVRIIEPKINSIIGTDNGPVFGFYATMAETNISARLRALRKKAGFSIRGLATEIKKTHSTYAFYESRYKKAYLPMPLVLELTPALVGRGEPPITETEVRELGIPIEVPAAPSLIKDRTNQLAVFASAQGGNDGMLVVPEAIDWIPRPAGVEHVKDAFAVYVVGDSMEPRIEQGELVVVNPSRAVKRGDDVVFVREEDNQWQALVKRLIGWNSDSWKVRQYTPARDFELQKVDWPKTYPVINRINV